MSDRTFYPQQRHQTRFATDRDIATELDAQFCLWRIGHAGSDAYDDTETCERAQWIGRLMTVLDR